MHISPYLIDFLPKTYSNAVFYIPVPLYCRFVHFCKKQYKNLHLKKSGYNIEKGIQRKQTNKENDSFSIIFCIIHII